MKFSSVFAYALAATGLARSQSWPPSTTFQNPVFWQDLADIDILRVDNTYYYSASTMHYSPGAPILRSYDLVNWEYAGHSVPVLDWSNAYSLNGGHKYVKGIWASFLNYRKSNSKFYWGGCIEFGKTYIYTASQVEGPWTKHTTINKCYYDAGLLIDDDDVMYVAYGNTNIRVAQLTADGLGEVRDVQVFAATFYLEGARFYKRNGAYYIWLTRPADAQFVLKSTSGPWGPYVLRSVLDRIGTPVPQSGVPHQGGLVTTPAGAWYYMAFIDAYPGGRVPVLAPITWSSDGWPVLTTVNGGWNVSYPYPNVPQPPRAVKAPTGTDSFTGTSLSHEWEWNHNPDNTKWSLTANGLRLSTATVVSNNNLYAARNTLTHRIIGPASQGTIILDYAEMRDGDVAGFSLFRDQSAYIAVKRANGAYRVVMVNGVNQDANWNTVSTGTEAASTNISGGRIYLRIQVNIAPGAGRQGLFFYSTNGSTWTRLGSALTLYTDWHYFIGYRYGIFNYASTALGGAVTVRSFEMLKT